MKDIPLRPPRWWERDLRAPTGSGVRVGVVDSGWDRMLTDPQVVQGVGLVDPVDELELLQTDDDNDRIGHGTACADLVLQIAPEVEIVPIRVFGQSLETSPHVLHAALLWAIEHRLTIVSMSLGTVSPEARDLLYIACELARRHGVIVVAAGKAGTDLSFPAVFDNVIGVGGGRFTSPYQYSYRHDEAMECVARGYNQCARTLGGRTIVGSGTSFAAPNITGIVALFRQRYPGADLTELRRLLERYAVDDGHG